MTMTCCDLHGRNCEPPSELCCERCTEATHPAHADGSVCSNPDLSWPADPEITALIAIVDALEGLVDIQAQSRVLRWASDRFGRPTA